MSTLMGSGFGTLNALLVLCRHLRDRLMPQKNSNQQSLVPSCGTLRVDQLNNGAPHAAMCVNSLDSTEASQAMQQFAASMPSNAAQPDAELGTSSIAGQVAGEAYNTSQPQGRCKSRAAMSRSAAQQTGHVKYLQKKQVPWLTGWWETTCAFMAVFLLPLISVVPFSTTAERPDSNFGQL